jgi:L-fuconate dehydratase
MTDAIRILSLDARDIRFPTSLSLDGSDAMHPSPDYSCAYAVLYTDSPHGIEGHGLTFTNGRGTEVVVAAVRALEHVVVGRTLEEITTDFRRFWRSLASEGQLRWLGPEKGVIHLATAAIVNAVWDLWAKREEKPLFRLLVDLTPEQLVAAIDFRYIDDVLTPDEALALLHARRAGRDERLAEIEQLGYPAYTTSAGWLGYPDEKIAALVREAAVAGFSRVKMKVGRDLEADAQRAEIIRSHSVRAVC